MNLNNLKPADGSVRNNKRVGRGQGSGRGATSTRGHKGAKSRAGYSHKVGFEGGQMPLQRRLPKYGFKNRFRVEYKAVNLDVIQSLADNGVTVIDVQTLKDAGLAPHNSLVKILGNGKLTSKVEVKANGFSKSAVAAIESLQGSATII
jgi:large subunit ribosomal protein L15